MNQYEENYYDAYEHGYEDFVTRARMWESDNPYKEGSVKASAWKKGFNDADNDDLSGDLNGAFCAYNPN